MDVFDAAQRYMDEGRPVIVLAGKEYGSGSSRDWAAKGPYLLGIKAVIAESYERIHRSNLVGMGLVPLQYQTGVNAETLGLTGKEIFTIELPEDLTTGQLVTVKVSSLSLNTLLTLSLAVTCGKCVVLICCNDFLLFQTNCGKSFQVIARFDTEVELMYFRHGGILNYMIRGML